MRWIQVLLLVITVTLDIIMAILALVLFTIGSLPLLLQRGRRRSPPMRPRMLYVGYTTLDQAHAKGLLQKESDIRQTYNPSRVLEAVTILIPFGKRTHTTPLTDDILFVEFAAQKSKIFTFTQKVILIIKGCLETRRQAFLHDVVMIGGPHIASIPSLYARITTPVRFVLFIEAFWEDILLMQNYMGRIEQAFWYRWYFLLYRVFDAYIGGPSYKPDFYVERGMQRDRIWPYIHQINAIALEEESAKVELPESIRNLQEPLLISIGRLEKEKLSIDNIIMAAHLSSTCTDFRMVIIGEGSERNILEAEITRAGLEKHILLLGNQPNAVTYAIAKRADACFAPYMGTALVEVLLAGCAVVAYDNDPHRGIAGDSPVLFVPHGDAAAGAEALIALLNDPVGIATRRENCRYYAWEKWNESAIGKAFSAPLTGRLTT